MTRRRDPLDRRFEDLLREQVSSASPDVMSGLVRELRRAYVAPLPTEVQNRQIADMVVAGRQAAASRPSLLRRRVNGAWYRFSRRFVAGSVVGKFVLAASVATAATTGMAATGTLPDPMQGAFSSAAEQIGVSIPAPAPAPVAPNPPAEAQSPKSGITAQVPASAPNATAPAPAPGGVSQTQPTATASPEGSCDRTVLSGQAGAQGAGDVVEALKAATDKQELERLLRCLLPTPAPAPAPPGAPGTGAGDPVEQLLEQLLGETG